MFLRSARSWIEAALFVLAVILGIAALAATHERIANALYFVAWCAALLLLFSLGLRLPLHLRGRYARPAAAALVIVPIGLALLSNIALYRHDVHFDVTVIGRYTAPPELLKVAHSLDRDVSVSYFYNSQDDNARAAKEILAALARDRPHLHFRALDLDKELVAARDYGVRLYNTAVVEAGGRRTEVDNTVDLRELAFAIERVLKERTEAVCFVTGHGEPYEMAERSSSHFGHVETLEGPGDVLEAPAGGIDRLKLAIEAIGYTDRAVATPTIAAIPSDCAVLADLGPRAGFAPDEVDMLRDYLARGGRLLLMYDPSFPVSPELQALLGKVGLAVDSGMVIDPVNHSGTDQEKVAVPYYPPHPITDQVALTVFPGPRPVRQIAAVAGIEATNLITTTKDSYVQPVGTATMAAAEPVGQPKSTTDAARGPATLAVALQGNWPEGDAKPFRLVLIGSASFATNAFFPYASNGDLAVSMIRWLAGDTGTPKLAPTTYSLPEVRLTHRQMQLTFFLIEILLPLSVMLFGVAIWRRRR